MADISPVVVLSQGVGSPSVELSAVVEATTALDAAVVDAAAVADGLLAVDESPVVCAKEIRPAEPRTKATNNTGARRFIDSSSDIDINRFKITRMRLFGDY